MSLASVIRRIAIPLSDREATSVFRPRNPNSSVTQ